MLRVFKATVQDVARSNRFAVWMPGMPPDLIFHCINVNIPGEQFATTTTYDQVKGDNFIPWETPYDITQNECSLTFMVDMTYRIHSYFQRWRKEVFDPKQGFGYMEDYAKDVKIVHLSRQHIPLYTTTLFDAWPKVITDINLDAAATNSPAIFSVNLVYGGQVGQDTLGFILSKIGGGVSVPGVNADVPF